MAKSGLHNDHRDRVRKRYIHEGIDNFADHEIIELLLHYSINYVDTNESAHRLIKRIGSFSGVFEAREKDLCSVKGVGEKSATFLKLVRDVGEIYSNEKKQRETFFKSVQSIATYCTEQYRNILSETYAVMLFDVSDRLLGFVRLPGSSWRDVEIIVKELGKYVFGYNATSFVLVRNSLNGDLTPSNYEMAVCKNIYKFFKEFNRVMSEYLILGGGRYIPVCKYSKNHNYW